jgi:hypothetical protein
MSRASHQKRQEAMASWPELSGLFGGCLHQDAVADHGSYEAAIKDQLSLRSVPELQALARQWWHWNATAGAVDDVGPLLNHLGMADGLTAAEARKFMNQVYDLLIVAIRRECPGWRPDN